MTQTKTFAITSGTDETEAESERGRGADPESREESSQKQVHCKPHIHKSSLKLTNSAFKMPNFAGTWKMKSSENFDELLKALGKSFSSAKMIAHVCRGSVHQYCRFKMLSFKIIGCSYCDV